MSLILKGIDLPTNGETLIVGIYGDGYVSVEHSKPLVLTIDPNAQAVQIPKGHGRLIDADELKEKRETMCWKDEYYMTHESDFIDSRYIDNAPTILEGEE